MEKLTIGSKIPSITSSDQNGKEMRRFKQSNEDRVTTQTMF